MKKSLYLTVLLALLAHCSSIAQGFRKTYPLSVGAAIDAVLPMPNDQYLFFSKSGNKNFWLVKTDAQGDTLWMKKYTKPEDASMRSARLYAMQGGNTALVINPTGTYQDSVIVMTFNPAGNLLAQRIFIGRSLVSTTDNGFFVASSPKVDTVFQLQRLDAQLNTLWSRPVTTSQVSLRFLLDMVTTPDGGVCIQVAGNTPEYPNLIKIDKDGYFEWLRTYTVTSHINLGNLIQAPNGDFILHSRHQSTYQSYIIRTTATGDFLWVVQLDYWLPSICMTTDGNIALCGNYLPLMAPPGPGRWIWYKLSGDGEPLDLKYIEFNEANAYGACIAGTPDGGMVMGGASGRPALVKTDGNGNVYKHFFSGKAWYDINHDCAGGTGDKSLAGWLVTATSAAGTASVRTAANGSYELNVPAGDYTLQIHKPGDLWAPCDNGVFSHTLSGPTDTVAQDFPVQDLLPCALPDVSLATGWLRPCRNTDYTLSWCNQGTIKATGVQIAVVLPPGLEYVSSTRPAEVHGDTLWFYPGDVDYLQCGDLRITAYVNCSSVQAGQTLCAKAFIFPDTLCMPLAQWSGARVVADARCAGDTLVAFSLTNTGSAPTQTLEYLVTEDYLALQSGNFQLGPGESLQLERPANGSTQRIEARQEPGYPLPSLPSAAVEGCGGWNTPGQVNAFPLDDASPFADIDCREVTSSFDPNDKQGFPAGYRAEHWIAPETELTYLIRFQNTGNDTAFYVEIRDTLSPWLDPATIRPAAASHPFEWNLRGGNALVFRFMDILLPDSTTNEAASQGFVQFRIYPKKDAPPGTVIENTSSIYFDYNAPVLTNTTYHKLGRDFYAVTLDKTPEAPLLPVQVQPNPFRDQTRLVLPANAAGNYRFRLYDDGGRLIETLEFSGTEMTLRAEGLRNGYYSFEMLNEKNQRVARGRIVRY